MTIEELGDVATDEERHSHEGEVVVRIPDDGSTYAVGGAFYDPEKQELVITIA